MFTSESEIVEKDFSAAKYLTSVEGILKLIAIVLLILSPVLFVFFSSCPGVPDWYFLVFPIVTGICGIFSVLFYLIYVCGIAKRNFKVWNSIDIVLTMISFILTIAVSILTMVTCNEPTSSQEYVFGPLAIIGAVCLAISVSVLLIKFRIDKDPVLEENNDEIPRNVETISAAQYRKSILI